MRFRLITILGLMLAGSLLADDDDEFILRPAPGALNRILTRYGLEVKKSFPGQNLYLVKPLDDDDDDDIDDLENSLRKDRDVLSIEQNEIVQQPEASSGSTSPDAKALERALLERRARDFFGAPLWEGFLRQPLVRQIGLDLAWERSRTGSGLVAVIDTGVDPDHVALRGALEAGVDFTTEAGGTVNEFSAVDASTRAGLTQSTTAFIDSSTVAVPLNNYAVAALSQSTTAFIDTGKLPLAFGHGTMVASLVRLSAPSARILPIRAFHPDGSSNTFDLLRAIYFAADRGAQVINMSFNMRDPSPELKRAVDYAAARKAILVASAGNDGNEIMVYPAGFANVMGVAAVDEFAQRSGFSNYGQELVTLAAPGQGVIVAYPGNNYASAWGTSFSTPLVSGAVTLLLQRNSALTAQQIESHLKNAARPTSSSGLGAGLLFVGNF